MKSAFQGPVIGNIGLTKDIAEGMIRSSGLFWPSVHFKSRFGGTLPE
jgi:hypothetical protein